MKRALYIIRQAFYSLFSFCYFLGFAFDMTIRGFFIITCGGATEKNKQKYHKILQKKSKYVINHVPGTTFQYANPHKETFEKPSVIICNHQSHLDLMAIMMLTPKLIILTKDWVWKNPFYGIVIRYADFFPISDIDEMTNNLKEMVKRGYSIMIFPEGTRSVDCHIQRFHRGAFYLAEKLQLDITPVYINGFGTVLPKTSFHLHTGHMYMEVMDRLHREELPPGSNYHSITKLMHQSYLKKHEEMCYNR